MSRDKIFTEEELETLGKLTVELIEASIDADQKEKAKKMSRRMYREFLSMHDSSRDWITALLTFIGRRYGDDALNDALKETCSAWLKPLCDRYAKEKEKGIRRRAEMMAAGYRGHLRNFRVEEDDEKVTLILDPCGSGGALVQEGAYEPPRNFLKVEKAQPMTFFRRHFPVYCAHCYFQNNLPVELCGEPLFITEPSKKPGVEPCRVHLYKKK